MNKIILLVTTNFRNLIRSKKALIIASLLVVVVGGYFLFRSKPSYQFVTVVRGPLTQSVSLTGNTTPAQSVSLAFASSGIISRTYTSLGKEVSKGQVLVDLNLSDLVAQLHSAQAAYTVAKTSYEKLANGASTPEIEVARVALKNAENAYNATVTQQKVLVSNARSAMFNSGLVALSVVSGTSTSDAPTISGTYTGEAEGVYTIRPYSTGDGTYFSVYGLESGGGKASTVAVPLGTRGLYIQFPSDSVSSSTSWTVSVPNSLSATYLTYYNAYQLALQTQSQALSTAQGVVDASKAALDQKLAGARTEDLTIAEAQVAQALANVESVQARIGNARIVAPISGTITQFDAKIGQQASPSTPLVSIMSNIGYEVDAGVSENDVGKILSGNKVTMTLDAFPKEVFQGTVFYIAPAETTTGGVVSYEVKIAFDANDPRLKSGLTANIDIKTNYKENVLILPQYAILQNDEGTFVEVLDGKKTKQNKVELGISDSFGNVEIISGVTEGEQVLSIGLKSK